MQLNSVMSSSKGTNKLCLYKRMSLEARCRVKVKEKYFKTKYRPADVLLNVNATMYFKLKLEIKYRNKN